MCAIVSVGSYLLMHMWKQRQKKLDPVITSKEETNTKTKKD